MNCINCCSGKLSLYCNLPVILFKHAYRIELCNECGIGFTVPQPNLNSNHYEDAVRPEIISKEVLHVYKKDLKFIIQAFESKNGRKPRTLLDVGCGNGLMLFVAQDFGLEVMGIEPSVGMYEFAKSKGLNVSNCYLVDFDEYKKYDLILLNSVIEHLPAPAEALDFLNTRVSDDALVIFQQAAFDGLVPRIFRWFWYGWAPSEHFFHYTEKSFSQFVEKNGFLVFKIKRSNLFYQFFWAGGLKTWKTFLYSNTLKLTSLVAQFTNRGDSLHVVTSRNKAWQK